ncbi:OmpA family protein [Wenzhouxiangella limi]|uniref:OmpA family protein n=1 Tax=Wenzhouxiangella limi TaxID=2707351 RepID=A0A845V615_9GAMM|nr:OmpA family protein [Wenzhouxiangella limi]NDY96616.1 OmpA family protein [Wenzhouxiangella limi]
MNTWPTASRWLIPALLIAALTACAVLEPPRREPPQTTAPERIDSLTVIASEADVATRRGALVEGENAVDAEAAGYFMDVFQARVRRDLSDTGIAIDYRERSVLITFPSQMGFESGSAQLTSEAARLIDRLAAVLREYRATLIVVSGHTDNVGDPDFNQRLSEQRARSVAQHLQDSGISHVRLLIRGFGSDRPVADNTSETGRARNRRVELMLELLVRDRPSQPEEPENA